MSWLLKNAFSLLKLPLASNEIIQNYAPLLTLIRTKKVKAGGSAHNRRRQTPGKHRRLYVDDGQWVEAEDLLVRQTGLQFYPGENVIFCHNRSLKALVPGHVIISLEKIQPYPDSPLHEYVSAGNLVERKFINIIPVERQGKYKFVEAI